MKRAARRFACVLLMGCGAPTPEPATTAPLPQPPAAASTVAITPSSPFTCQTSLPGAAVTLLPDRTPGVPGQMTEEAARAKRLYDAERWDEVVAALARVASGATGDDQGNRELAQYHMAIALYRAHRVREAAVVFAEMARDRGHLKHNETVLWIYKLAPDAPELVRSLVAYDDEEVSRFNNANQREVYWGLNYLVGRERYERGARDEAAAFFARVGEESAFKDAARDCLARLRR
jgi:hypothetical protein